MSRPTADRRWWQLRGRRPHEFGRYRTVRALVVQAPSAERVIVRSDRASLGAGGDRGGEAGGGDRGAAGR